MSKIITLEARYESLAFILIILGFVLLFCNHCARLIAFRELQNLYSACDDAKKIVLNNSSERLVIRNDCWSGEATTPNQFGISSVAYPENAEYAVQCLGGLTGRNKTVIYYPLDINYIYLHNNCLMPLRFKSVNATTLTLDINDYKPKQKKINALER